MKATTRRTFLKTAMAGTIATGELLAQTKRNEQRKWFDALFRDDPVAPAPHKPDPQSWEDSSLTAAWIGHATVLINFFGTTILTDPVFSARAGIRAFGLYTIGPKRLVAPALSIDEIPPVDLILLSHAHMDHLDLATLHKLDRRIPVVTAKHTRDLLAGRGWKTVVELDWNESMEIAGVRIEALQVRHFGRRFPWERDRARGQIDGRSFNAYLLSRNGRNIVFGGDTAYHDYFKDLAVRNIPVDLAMLPIGAYDPWIWVHASPEQAVAMADHMKAKTILPIHWGTFVLSNEPMDEPIERLKRALFEHSPELALTQIGETWRLPNAIGVDHFPPESGS